MASAVASSVSARRLHYQSQNSNAQLSLSQSFSIGEPSNLNDSFSSSFASSNPLVTIIYSNASSKDNQQLIMNSWASCRRLLDHMKSVVGVQQDETIDLMDSEGKLKDLTTHFDEYATHFLIARNTYYVLKVEIDNTSGEKRYTASFNLDQIDQKLSSILTNSLNSLNKSINKPKQRNTGISKQNSSAQLSSTSTQPKTKRTLNKK